MTTRFVERRRKITDALDDNRFDVKEKGPRAWCIDHDGLSPRGVDVELVDGWLCLHEPLVATSSESDIPDAAGEAPRTLFEAPAEYRTATSVQDAPSARTCWSYLQARPFADSKGKIALDPADGSARLREDIPLGDGIDLSEACRNAVSGFAVARTVLSDPKKAAAQRRRKKTAVRNRPRRGKPDRLDPGSRDFLS